MGVPALRLVTEECSFLPTNGICLLKFSLSFESGWQSLQPSLPPSLPIFPPQ